MRRRAGAGVPAKHGAGMGAKAVQHALWRCLRYSFGSVVLGGLVIAVIRFLRWCLLHCSCETSCELGAGT